MKTLEKIEKIKLKRVFLFRNNGQEIRLDDPGEEFTPADVQNMYSGIYPPLTNAKLMGPEIKNDERQFRFDCTMGVKG